MSSIEKKFLVGSQKLVNTQSLVATRKPLFSTPFIPFNRLWKSLHIIAVTYNPECKENIKYFKCFFYSFSKLLPTIKSREIIKNFIGEYPIDDYLSSKSKVFQWTWLMHNYTNKELTKNSSSGISLLKAIEIYDEKKITKKEWGNALWDLIHIIAKYLPFALTLEIRKEFVSFIICCQKLLPCGECSEHMIEHLKVFSIDKYTENALDIFTWTVELHNRVNYKRHIDYNVILIFLTVKEAWYLY